MTERKMKRLARSLREASRGDYTPTLVECETYIADSIAGVGFARSHETRCYRKHGVAYCRLVEAWHQMTVKMGGIEAVRGM